jgi:hypothetical protein
MPRVGVFQDLTNRALDVMRLKDVLKVALESTHQFIVMTSPHHSSKEMDFAFFRTMVDDKL